MTAMETHLAEETLHQLFDGELDAVARAEAEAHVTACAACGRELQKLERLHQAFAMTFDDAERDGSDIDSAALFARVREGVTRERQEETREETRAEPQKLRVIQGAGEPKKKKAWVPVAATLALAAAVLLAIAIGRIASSPSGDPSASPSQIAQNLGKKLGSEVGQRLGLPPALPIPAAAASLGSAVVEVDFGANTGTVFELENTVGASVAVVWINDEETP